MEDTQAQWASQLKKARQTLRSAPLKSDQNSVEEIQRSIDDLSTTLLNVVETKDTSLVEDIFSQLLEKRALLAAHQLAVIQENNDESERILKEYAQDCARLAYAIDLQMI